MMNNKYFSIILCMNALPTCVHVHRVHAWCLWKSEEGLRVIGTGVSHGCGTPMVLRTEPGPCKSSKYF